MNLTKDIVARIETGNPIVLNFDYDEFEKKGSTANVIGLALFNDQWYVDLEFHNQEGIGQTITMSQYINETMDIIDS